ncbi:MAG: ATP-binding protein [Bdellovibrionia bacterium]
MMPKTIFDSLLEPTFVLDAAGIIIYCNETAAILAGSSVRKIQRQKVTLTSLFSFSDPLKELADIYKITEPTPYKEITFSNANGTEGKTQITLQCLVPQQEWLVFMRDVTLEERLQKKYRAELEQKEGLIQELESANKKLEDYSKNLEIKVAERTQELTKINSLMGALLNSLNDGFFVFNAEGICLEVSSNACTSTVECNPAGKFIWDVLKLNTSKRENFQKWMTTLFAEMLPFEDLAPLGPNKYEHSQNLQIELNYYPIRTPENLITGVVVVASDRTKLIAAQQEAAQEKAFAKKILTLVQKKKELSTFIAESKNLFATSFALLKNNKLSTAEHEDLFRFLHTLKGGSATFGLLELASALHICEDSLHAHDLISLGHQLKNAETIFKNFLDLVVQVYGERFLSSDSAIEVQSQDLKKATQHLLSHNRSQFFGQLLQKKYLLTSIDELLLPYLDFTQNLARENGKKVHDIRFAGDKLYLSREVYSPIFSAFVHIFKNFIDHALETPEERLALNKPEGGLLHIECSIRSDFVLLEFRDDGRGIDPTKIRQKLSSLGVHHESLSDSEVLTFIFAPQFSTQSSVTELSGRGVGMDAIKYQVEKLGGKVGVKSQMGAGTTIEVQLPLSPHLYAEPTGQLPTLQKVS